MEVYRIYNDEGFPMIQTNDEITKTDILTIACEQSKKQKDAVITVWKCETDEDECYSEEMGVINENQILVADFFDGRMLYD